jgi:beta-aspartyl-peptidase (threonine type)
LSGERETTTLPIALAVHGGAWNLPDEAVDAARDGLRTALDYGWRLLREGAPALDAVEQVVRLLEDDPHFDAGRGSRLNREGRVEMDASIMDGSNLEAGAVAAIQRVRHPVSVARKVMEQSPHVMLVGEGAFNFADEVGAELCRTSDLLVGRERERYVRVRAGERHLVEQEFDRRDDGARGPLGTVGAVALDGLGNLAAATSTGGTQDKAPGRVGDTPVIGAGTYADNRTGAASATGWGEGILRVVLAKTAVDLMAAGHEPRTAGRRALETLARVRGKAGLILIDPRGRVACVFDTPRMVRGWATEGSAPQVLVDPSDTA